MNMGNEQIKNLVAFKPNLAATSFQIKISLKQNLSVLTLQYSLIGNHTTLILPSSKKSPSHKEGLYRHTCFEAFVGGGKTDKYTEFNFSPSGDWCAIFFDNYRKPSNQQGVEKPNKLLLSPLTLTENSLNLKVVIDLSALKTPPLKLGLSTVLEHSDNSLSYWSLSHGNEKADFHNSEHWLELYH